MHDRGEICQRCKLYSEDPDTFIIDHIIPRRMGFPSKWYRKYNNKQLLCLNCQRMKNIVEDAYRKKWGITKGSYILLLNGFGTPLEAVTAMQREKLDFNNMLLD